MKKNPALEKVVKDDRAMAALKAVADEMIINWDSTSCVKDTAFETAKATIEKESKVKALQQFFAELEQKVYA